MKLWLHKITVIPTHVSRSLAPNGSYALARLPCLKGMQGSSVGGAIHMQKGRAQGLEIGNQKLSDIDFLRSSDEEGSLSAKWEAGNIGNEILRHFKVVTFDSSSERMYLQSLMFSR